MDSEWIENLSKIATQAVEAGKPCAVEFGKVASTSPLSVYVEQKTTLAANQLLVPQSLTDHSVQMSIPGIGDVSASVQNALKAGDQVIMVRKKGAQLYLIIDRY